MTREPSEEAVRTALATALEQLGVGDVEPGLERPRDPEHGDWATNVALTLASRLGRPPREIAADIVDHLPLDGTGITGVEIAGPGFLNFRLSDDSVAQGLSALLRLGRDFGRSNVGNGESVMVEWVSANPTGPLHLGHGRQAALGDGIAFLLDWTGWKVHREFYYNDAGGQMERLARSVFARYQQALGVDAAVPEDGYQGEYVVEVADALVARDGDRHLEAAEADRIEVMGTFASQVLMADIRRDLDEFRVTFDEYFQETSLYEHGRVADTISALRDTGLVFEADGAVWFRTTEFGDQEDRVMVKSDGSPTYFVPDVAYHMDKWERGFRQVINVQGSDHHATVTKVHAGLQALGYPEGYPEYVLHQMVTVEQHGREVKASKRAGSYVRLRELLEEVGVDVTRYFFQMRKPEGHLVFDLDVALDQSEKNPVYKVQYAHARMHSICGKAGVDPNTISGEGVDLGLLNTDDERQLIQLLTAFPEWVDRAAAQRSPHLVCDYLEQAAGRVNSWYHAGNPNRNPGLAVLVDDDALRAARLALVSAVIIVLGNGLKILGIHAPRRMDRGEPLDS